MKRATYASLVVYVRNDLEHVEPFLKSVGEFLRDAFELYEIVLVDDASTDGSLEQARRIARDGELQLTILELGRRHGVEAAIQAALERSAGDWVFELESPALDFPLALLTDMYEQASRGFDIVTATGDEGSARSRLFYSVVNRYADLDEPLRTVRLRLTSRRSLATMLSMKEKVRYRKALYAYVGARQHHLTYTPTASLRAERRLNRETSSLASDLRK